MSLLESLAHDHLWPLLPLIQEMMSSFTTGGVSPRARRASSRVINVSSVLRASDVNSAHTCRDRLVFLFLILPESKNNNIPLGRLHEILVCPRHRHYTHFPRPVREFMSRSELSLN